MGKIDSFRNCSVTFRNAPRRFRNGSVTLRIEQLAHAAGECIFRRGGAATHSSQST